MVEQGSELMKKKCVSCEGGASALSKEEVREHVAVSQWEASDDYRSIHRRFELKNFMAAIRFINKIAEIAESENHHPDIHLTNYREVLIELSTHAICGLSENDFILSTKIDALLKK